MCPTLVKMPHELHVLHVLLPSSCVRLHLCPSSRLLYPFLEVVAVAAAVAVVQRMLARQTQAAIHCRCHKRATNHGCLAKRYWHACKWCPVCRYGAILCAILVLWRVESIEDHNLSIPAQNITKGTLFCTRQKIFIITSLPQMKHECTKQVRSIARSQLQGCDLE